MTTGAEASAALTGLQTIIRQGGAKRPTAQQLFDAIMSTQNAVFEAQGRLDAGLGTTYGYVQNALFQEADRSSRYAVATFAIVGSNPGLLNQIVAAFGVTPPAPSTPLAVGIDAASNAALNARVKAAFALCLQSTDPNAPSVQTWITSTLGFNADYQALPQVQLPIAQANFQAAVDAGNAFVSAASFQ